MSGFAGMLGERVTMLVRAATRDDLGGADGGWSDGLTVWASVRPDGAAPLDEAGPRQRWTVTLRSGVAVPERLRRGGTVLAVRRSEQDPARPERLILYTEETR